MYLLERHARVVHSHLPGLNRIRQRAQHLAVVKSVAERLGAPRNAGHVGDPPFDLAFEGRVVGGLLLVVDVFVEAVAATSAFA